MRSNALRSAYGEINRRCAREAPFRYLLQNFLLWFGMMALVLLSVNVLFGNRPPLWMLLVPCAVYGLAMASIDLVRLRKAPLAA